MPMLSNADAIVQLQNLLEQKANQMGDNNNNDDNNNNKPETTITGSKSCRGLWPAAKNGYNKYSAHCAVIIW